jgi:hypothetical protein
MQRLSGLHQDWRMIGEVLLSLLIPFPNAKIPTLSALPHILGTFRPNEGQGCQASEGQRVLGVKPEIQVLC